MKKLSLEINGFFFCDKCYLTCLSDFYPRLNPSVSAITKLGKQAVSDALGPRIPLVAPSGSKPDFGLRAVPTFVFTK